METKWPSGFRIVCQRLMYMIQLAAYCNIKAIIKVKKKSIHIHKVSLWVNYGLFTTTNSIFLQPNKMGHDVSTGIIEFIMDHFTEENEGTFTCQITDGGGKAQSSLVLIGDGKRGQVWFLTISTSTVFLKWSNHVQPGKNWLRCTTYRAVISGQ